MFTKHDCKQNLISLSCLLSKWRLSSTFGTPRHKEGIDDFLAPLGVAKMGPIKEINLFFCTSSGARKLLIPSLHLRVAKVELNFHLEIKQLNAIRHNILHHLQKGLFQLIESPSIQEKM